MMAFDVQAVVETIQRSRQYYGHVLESIPDEKLNWRPTCPEGGDATTVLEITRHIIASEVHFLRMFGIKPSDVGFPVELDTPPPMREDWATAAAFAEAGIAAGLSTKTELLGKLAEVAEIVDKAVSLLPLEKWDEEHDAWFMKAPRKVFLGFIAPHYAYHTGQLGYIARMWGDLSF
jgi:hypothetical protein